MSNGGFCLVCSTWNSRAGFMRGMVRCGLPITFGFGCGRDDVPKEAMMVSGCVYPVDAEHYMSECQV